MSCANAKCHSYRLVVVFSSLPFLVTRGQPCIHITNRTYVEHCSNIASRVWFRKLNATLHSPPCLAAESLSSSFTSVPFYLYNFTIHFAFVDCLHANAMYYTLPTHTIAHCTLGNSRWDVIVEYTFIIAYETKTSTSISMWEMIWMTHKIKLFWKQKKNNIQ